MNLVIGATGMLGSKICQLLREKELPVRAMVRETSDPVKVYVLKEQGVEVVEGDLRQSLTFKPALEGVSTIITTASSIPFAYVAGENDPILVDQNGLICLIDEAKVASVKRFIYTSFSGNMDLNFPLGNAKRAVEDHLKQSGIVYTILRPGFFMEAWLSATVGFDVENGKVQIFGNGRNPVCYISYKDVAKYALESLENPSAKNALLELGGPEYLSQLDVVEVFENAAGKQLEKTYLPVEALKEQLDSASDMMQKSFSGLMLCLANGDKIEMESIFNKFSVQSISVREYATQIHQVTA